MGERLPDIRLIKGRFTTTIIPVSLEGRRWVRTNMERQGVEMKVEVQTEYLDDILEEFAKGNMIVEGSR